MERRGANNGLSLPGVIGVIFIVLKLCDVINWSWWWVLSPWWISILAAIAMLAVLGGIMACARWRDK